MEPPFALDGYALTDLIGFGATGEVWRGRDETTHEPVALKRLWEPAADGLVERLRHDAAVVAEVAGPHAVRVLEAAQLAGGEVVLVMDYAEGGSLASLLARRGRLHPSEVVTILGPLAQALAALHRRGLVHGDLTPSNVLFAADGRPMFADVGLAIVTSEHPGDDLGYRDPALDAAMPPTAASDCFGLAALGYAALTGVPPRSASRPDVIEPITGRAPWVPASLATVVEAALVGDASMRPDVATFGTAVLDACGAAPVRLTGPRRSADPDAAAAAPMPTSRPRSRRLVIASVVAAILLVSALAGIVSARFNPPHASALQPRSTAADYVPDPPATPRWKDPTPWRPIVTRLLALRAKALATGRRSLLTSIYWPASFAYDMDDASLRIMRSEGVRTCGFTQRVVKLGVVNVAQGRTVLAVTTSIPPYSVVDRNGVVVANRAGRTQRFELVIERHHHEWLIQSLDRPPLVAAAP
ncbi:MAG TPA: serine/threonine-protein kinase [Mycobacteriales bacterium]|nr:serine/threonine-protein kinase [Mycobacteriales bacterium]